MARRRPRRADRPRRHRMPGRRRRHRRQHAGRPLRDRVRSPPQRPAVGRSGLPGGRAGPGLSRAGRARGGVQALTLVDGWPVDHAAVVVVGPDGVLAARGDLDWTVRLASVTKLFVAYGCLIARQEGVLDLDAPAGPPGATVRHLLAHASGLGFDDTVPVSPVGRRRAYSNPGFERLGEVLAERDRHARRRVPPRGDLHSARHGPHRAQALPRPRRLRVGGGPEPLRAGAAAADPGRAAVAGRGGVGAVPRPGRRAPGTGRQDPWTGAWASTCAARRSPPGWARRPAPAASGTSAAAARSSGSIPSSTGPAWPWPSGSSTSGRLAAWIPFNDALLAELRTSDDGTARTPCHPTGPASAHSRHCRKRSGRESDRAGFGRPGSVEGMERGRSAIARPGSRAPEARSPPASA